MVFLLSSIVKCYFVVGGVVVIVVAVAVIVLSKFHLRCVPICLGF